MEVKVTPRSLVESAADISVLSERVRREGGGPPIEMCEHFDAFSGRSPSHFVLSAAFPCGTSSVFCFGLGTRFHNLIGKYVMM